MFFAKETSHRDDQGSALVEAIGMMALAALLISAIFSIALALHSSNELRHAAALASRAGAIAGADRADEQVKLLVKSPVAQEFHLISCGGLSYFEVRLKRDIRTIFGTRTVSATGHALVEGIPS